MKTIFYSIIGEAAYWLSYIVGSDASKSRLIQFSNDCPPLPIWYYELLEKLSPTQETQEAYDDIDDIENIEYTPECIAKFDEYLAAKYLSSATETTQQEAFEMAWARGATEGHHAVEKYYAALADLMLFITQ